MPVLYHVHLSRHVSGCVRGPVRAIPATGFQFDVCAETGAHIVPDFESVIDCLPASYRKAATRAGARFGRYAGSAGQFHVTLHDARNRYLNTVYMIAHPDSVQKKVA